MQLKKMAWRNLWRNPRRTIVTAGAMTLALLVMILFTGLAEGFLVDMEESMLELEIGDIQIHHSEYRDDPSIYNTVEGADIVMANLVDRGYPAAGRLLGGGLVAGDGTSAGASLRGIDLDRDSTVVQISMHTTSGAWLSADDPMGVVLGRRIAKTLDVKPGDELIALAQAADGSMANELFQVRGILAGISDDTDRSAVFMLDSTFRDFFSMPDGVHQILVRRPQVIELEAATEEVRAIAPGLDARSWRELLPTIASYLDSARAAMSVMFVVVYIAIAILILNAMLMAVFERIREFGVLKALGVEPRQVVAVILLESGIQTLLALAAGVLLSLPALWYLSVKGIDMGALAGAPMMGLAMSSVMYALVTPLTFIGPIGLLVLVVLMAALYPALKAARIAPVEAMRYH